jgi:hypothetical protein
MNNLLKILIFNCILLLFSGCIKSLPVNRLNCESINEFSKVCRDSTHKKHCRLHIKREMPYPDTVTEKFLCDDTGFLGHTKRNDSWTRERRSVK